MKMSLLALLIGWTLWGCHREPTVGDVSLTCRKDSHCQTLGEDWRCFDGLCVRNTAPQLQAVFEMTPDGDRAVNLAGGAYAGFGEALQLRAAFSDPDQDAFTVTWTAQGELATNLVGPSVEGPVLDATLTTLGIHEFLLMAEDSLGAQTIVPFRVVVQPTTEAVYVSKLGQDDEQCGDIDHPCRTILQGRAVLDQRPNADAILLAAVTGVDPYQECVRLDGSTQLLGCFDPLSWAHDSDMKSRCRIECRPCARLAGGDDGACDPVHTEHAFSGNAQAREVTFGLAPDVTQLDGTDSPPVTTVRIDTGRPILTDVEVEVAACGTGCSAVGLLSVGGDPQLWDVDLRAVVNDFDFLSLFMGAVVIGGAPEIHGGQITINAPAMEAGGGLIMIGSDPTIDGLSVRGGPAPALYGVFSLDSAPTLENMTLDLDGLASHQLYGVSLSTCVGDDSLLCACSTWLPEAECTGPWPPSSTGAEVKLADSTIQLDGATGELGSTPCLALGLSALLSDRPLLISGNTIQLGRNIALSIGLLAQGQTTPDGTEATHRIVGNTITVGDAGLDLLCVAENQEAGFGDLASSALGLGLSLAGDTTLADNTVTVGNNQVLSTGLSIYQSGPVFVADNQITVGAGQSGFWSGQAMGAVLADNLAVEPSVFTRNEVRISDPALDTYGRMRGGATSGTALWLGLTAEAVTPSWVVTNNFIFGGRIPHSTGFSIYSGASDTSAPIIQQNTIHGGGDLERGLVSCAVETILSGASVLQNNLIDAGDSMGRRLLFRDPFGEFFATSEANVGQFVGNSFGPQPAMAVPAWKSDPIVRPGASADDWHVLMRGAGTMVSLFPDPSDPSSGLLEKPIPTRIPGAPSAWWRGAVDGFRAVAVTVPQGVALAWPGDDGQMGEFQVVPYSSDATVAFEPCGLALTDANGERPDDILFIQNPARARGADITPGLWLMRGRRVTEGGGYESAQPVPNFPLNAPTLLAVGPNSGRLFVADGDALKVGTIEQPIAVPLVDLVEGNEITSMLTESYGFVPEDELADDLTLIAGGSLYVFFGFGEGSGIPIPFDELPCVASTVTQVAVGNVNAQVATKDIVVGCDDGTIELFSYFGGRFLDPNAALPPAATGPISFLSIGILSEDVVGTGPIGRLLIGRVDPTIPLNRVESYHLITSVTISEWTQVGSIDLVADIAACQVDTDPETDAQTHRWVSTLPDNHGGVTLIPASDPNACPLAARASPNDPFDLHLTDTTACVDQGIPLDPPILDDIDSCNSRMDTPDVGADEFAAAGQSCDDT